MGLPRSLSMLPDAPLVPLVEVLLWVPDDVLLWVWLPLVVLCVPIDVLLPLPIEVLLWPLVDELAPPLVLLLPEVPEVERLSIVEDDPFFC